MAKWWKHATAGVATIAIFSGSAVLGQALTETTVATPAMWRVADADSEFILLGTFHILPPDLEWRSDALTTAIEEAETVYFEVEIDATDTQSKAINAVMTQGFNASGKTLTGMLQKSDAQRLSDIAASLGLPMAGIDTMRPWNAFLTLTVQFIVKQGFEPGAGVDSILLAEMRTLGKDLVFFETIEEQLDLFIGLAPETEKALLTYTIRDWDNQSEALNSLFNAWANGDVDFMDAQMNEIGVGHGAGREG